MTSGSNMSKTMEVEQTIIAWLEAHSVALNLQHVPGRAAFLAHAGLHELQNAIHLEGSALVFCGNLLGVLASYGALADGRDPVVALFDAAKTMVGEDKRAECDALIAQWRQRPSVKKDKIQISTPKRLHWYNIRIAVIASIFVIGIIVYFYILQTRELIKPFEKGTFGVLVAAFNEKTKESKGNSQDLQISLESTLNARFRELNIQNAEAKIIPITLNQGFQNHEDARAFGRNYGAYLVIWGNFTIAGIIPNLTLVNPMPAIRNRAPVKAEFTLLKDTLSFGALEEIKDIRLPAFTDEPIQLISFVTGLNYIFEKDYTKAAEYLTFALPNEPSNYIDTSMILSVRGSIYLENEDYEKALYDFNKAITLNPNDPFIYTVRGSVYFYQQDYKKAIENQSKALELDPNNDDAYYNRGNTYLRTNEWDKAAADFSKIIELNKPDTKCLYCAYKFRAEAYYKLNNIDQAIADYEHALTINSEVETYVNAGFAYFAKGDIQDAQEKFFQANRLDKDSAALFYIMHITFSKVRRISDEYKIQEEWTDFEIEMSLKEAIVACNQW